MDRFQVEQGLRGSGGRGAGAIFRAEFARRHAKFAFEGHTEILDMVETGALGDFFEGEFGFQQEFLHAAELDAQDFLVRGAADKLFETVFEEAAALGHSFEDVLHVDAEAGIFADVMDGARDVAVLNGEHIGGLAGEDTERGNEMGFAFDLAASHHFIEEMRGLVTRAVGVRDDAGERGIRQSAEQVIVIYADDGNFVRDGDANAAAGIEHLLAAQVVTGHDTDWLGQGPNPFGEVSDLGFVVNGEAFGGAIMAAFATRGADAVIEVLAAPFGPVKTAVASVAEIFEAAVEEVFGGQVGHSAVVRFKIGERRNQAGGAHVHNGHVELAQGRGNGVVLDAGDDAVAIPIAEPARWFVAAAMFGEVKGPGLVFANVGNNAVEETASVGVRGLDQKCDFGRRFHDGCSGE